MQRLLSLVLFCAFCESGVLEQQDSRRETNYNILHIPRISNFIIKTLRTRTLFLHGGSGEDDAEHKRQEMKYFSRAISTLLSGREDSLEPQQISACQITENDGVLQTATSGMGLLSLAGVPSIFAIECVEHAIRWRTAYRSDFVIRRPKPSSLQWPIKLKLTRIFSVGE